MSAPKRKTLLSLAVLATGLCLLVLGVLMVLADHSKTDGYATKDLVANGAHFKTMVADTDVLREKGLGQRSSLPSDQAMVFTYPRTTQLCFWMKDMSFSIDMVWLDSGKKVVATEANVSPNTYPKSYCHDASYVVEFNAGATEKIGLKTGDSLTF